MYSDFDELRAMEKYFELESQALHDSIYRREETQALRKYVVRFICINSRTSEQLDAFIPYLAVTYFDRFISKHPKLPTVVGRDRVYRGRALAICCLSLAWKMRSKSFKFKDFLKEKSEIQIYRNDILKMEFQILDVLDWRLRDMTALCFVQYFLILAPIPRLNLKHFSGIIIQSQGDIQFTRFKPSVIAASAILAANHFLYPNEHDTVKRKLSAGQHVRLDENKLTSCLNSMIDMCASMGLVVKKEVAQRMAVDGPSSSRQVEGETEIGAADEEPPLLHKSEKEDAQRMAMEEPNSIRQVEGETEIGAADKERPLLHKSEKEDAQRMALEGSSLSRQVEGETEIVAVDEETTLLHKSEKEDAQRMGVEEPSSSQQAEGETPFRPAPGKEVVGLSMIQEVLVAEEEDLKWKIDDHVEADYLMALAAFDSDPEELAGIVAWLSKCCLCIR